MTVASDAGESLLLGGAPIWVAMSGLPLAGWPSSSAHRSSIDPPIAEAGAALALGGGAFGGGAFGGGALGAATDPGAAPGSVKSGAESPDVSFKSENMFFKSSGKGMSKAGPEGGVPMDFGINPAR